jgi:hypothetical protein
MPTDIDPPEEGLRAALGQEYRTIQERLRVLRPLVKASVIDDVRHHGVTENGAATKYGVDRMTVRSWLGKR